MSECLTDSKGEALVSELLNLPEDISQTLDRAQRVIRAKRLIR